MPKYLVTATGRAGIEVSADDPEVAVRWAAKHGPKLRGIVYVVLANDVHGERLEFKVSPSGKKVKLMKGDQ